MNTNRKGNKGYIIHMPGDMMVGLRQVASGRGEPVSVVIREAIREYLRALEDRTYEIYDKGKRG